MILDSSYGNVMHHDGSQKYYFNNPSPDRSTSVMNDYLEEFGSSLTKGKNSKNIRHLSNVFKTYAKKTKSN